MNAQPSRGDEPLHFQPEWCRVTLASIGDAVITTDTEGRVTFLNHVAEALTGWPLAEASGVPLERVFRIVNQETRRRVESLTVRTEWPIDDSAAPIRNDTGEVAGVVLVFREIAERYRQEQALAAAAAFTAGIIATLREPFLVLDKELRVKTANRAFYETFRVGPRETEGRFLYELGTGQWDSPRLRGLLGKSWPTTTRFATSRWSKTSPRSAARPCCSTPPASCRRTANPI